MNKEQYDKVIKALVSEQLEKTSMLFYEGKLKGVLILAIDTDNVFRMMEGYGSDTLFAMNTALDIAKDHALQKVKLNLIDPPKEV